MEIGWDEILQDNVKGIFEMEVEDFGELDDEAEEEDSMVCSLYVCVRVHAKFM